MVQTPGAIWVFLAAAALLVLWSLLRKPRSAPGRHQHVSFRILWWRKLAPPECVNRELVPLEAQLEHLRPIAALFPDHADAEEGDHARR